MKASAIVSGVVAASLGLGSVSSFAQGRDGRDERRAERFEHRQDRRAERFEHRQDHRGARFEHRQDRRAERFEQRQDWRAQQRIQPAPAPVAREPHWQPRAHAYTYNQPNYQQYQYRHQYRSAPYYAPRHVHGGSPTYYYVGDRLPYDHWRGMRVVNNWPAYSLYAPPHGYHWVQSDTGEFLLIAIATGIIANLLLNR